MQFKTLLIASVAAFATASPTKDKPESPAYTPESPAASTGECTPATYECTIQDGEPGWNVCNTSSQWVFGGFCPPKTKCYFNETNQSPYCI